jgi:transcriptional regulator with PAS, ATPase and Fis domain
MPFVGKDATVRELLRTVKLVADTDATVLITGETGTGKEIIARALHAESSRRDHSFIPVNCGALADTLLESELFGHLRGAFTGATEARPGKFEAANGGTIFLDEIGDMNQALQVKLLRVLQSGEYAPVGSASSRRCDVRVVAASNQPLRPLVTAGRVRADLYYRVNVISLDVPPLRERAGDVPELIAYFLREFSGAYARGPMRLSARAHSLLVAYSYPGNVRELENAIRRAVILCQSDEIDVRHLPIEVVESDPVRDSDKPAGFHAAREKALGEFERTFLIGLLRDCGGIVSRAADRSGLSERNLHVKLKKHGLRGRDFRSQRAWAG